METFLKTIVVIMLLIAGGKKIIKNRYCQPPTLTFFYGILQNSHFSSIIISVKIIHHTLL